ncbi:substrate-binding domain-containing protein [Christensenella tenuis]|jgi:simple sugar transport system substrate-binding protein|uniref:Substrate-binding domain-containing protein n=1 Tax=Christensenella tenuis TaxID=2763033 RepID=A0ABR7EDD1_9FIRM|nr:substrate-binding domain-containing protein [Christensenella tenuis]MBC5647790.1 substrate-binding domain-containing protein [Christensenella tenuis]
MKKISLLLVVVLVLVFCFAATACSSTPPGQQLDTDNSEEDTSGDQKTAVASDQKYALVLHTLNSSFAATIGEGAKKAGEDLGVTVDVMGPTGNSSLDEQVSMIESCIAAGYDGIATVVWDEDGFTGTIEKAHAAGIPVIACNQDSDTSGADAFVGQALEESGYVLGKYMFGDVMGGSGKYIIGSLDPAQTALVLRIDGIKRAQEEFPDVELVDVIDYTDDLTQSYSIIENAYLANPDVKAFLGTDFNAEAIGTFIETNNLQGKLFGGGYDLTEGIIKHLNAGTLAVTINQEPFYQGYYPIIQLHMMNTTPYKAMDMITEAALVTPENVGDYPVQ